MFGVYRYRLDAWDGMILLVGAAAGIGAGIKFGDSIPLCAALGVGGGLAGARIRRQFAPKEAGLVHEEPPKQVTRTVLPMLLIGIGGLISVVGMVLLVWAVAGVADDSEKGLPGFYLILPVAVLAGALALIVFGINWAGRLSDRAEQGPTGAESGASGNKRNVE